MITLTIAIIILSVIILAIANKMMKYEDELERNIEASKRNFFEQKSEISDLWRERNELSLRLTAVESRLDTITLNAIKSDVVQSKSKANKPRAKKKSKAK